MAEALTEISRDAERSPLTIVSQPPKRERRLYPTYGKAGLDRAGGFVIFVAVSPVMAILALIVRLRLGSPIFYVHERIGLDGQPFRMYKFRTMNPDRRQTDVAPEIPDRRVRHKTVDDPRHTSLGRFLRKHSLDELPQLWNVLKGDMSLVGPRPELPTIVARYEPWQHGRHSVKPGLTGLWQVSRRNIGDGSLMFEHTDIDIEYLNQVSLKTDLRIIVNTFRVLADFSAGGE
jgi:lipopolysaccharide/colanic/teichoic acid biosynthesis glycosyltransferase